VFQTRYLKVTFRINGNIFHFYFTSVLKPIYNSITGGLNFHISGRFLFNTGASPRCPKLQDTSLLYILTTLLLGSMHFHFLSVYFLLCFSPSCTSFYALCSSVVSCLSQGSFSNKFHKTWFRVRKDLQCIVLKQGTYLSPYSSIILPHNDTYFQCT
jgi:hypothetical protein